VFKDLCSNFDLVIESDKDATAAKGGY
ncbi:unnamed protein product, partial [Rotaria sp. Silwood2]